jgi:uncharacterized membrane protein
MVLAYGILKKNDAIIRLSYGMFVICAISSFVSGLTGEGAEAYLRDLSLIEDAYLEKHTNMAGIANIGMILLGVLSLLTLFVRKLRDFKGMPYIILVISLFVAGSMFYTGKLGGEIMHKEIRGAGTL